MEKRFVLNENWSENSFAMFQIAADGERIAVVVNHLFKFVTIKICCSI